MTSTAALVGSATKGVAKGVGAISGDKEFVKQRDERRRYNTASSGGVLTGGVHDMVTSHTLSLIFSLFHPPFCALPLPPSLDTLPLTPAHLHTYPSPPPPPPPLVPFRNTGVRAGSESLMSGFKSGFAGLMTRPFEEGKKSGALGFVRGIGETSHPRH